MKKEFVNGWGIPFKKTRSDFAQAMWELEGRARKEKWDDDKYESECQKIKQLNLSKKENYRVFD
jgi:hypothetical protein